MNEHEKQDAEKEARLELKKARMLEIEEWCKRHGIPFRDTTLEHEGEATIFLGVRAPGGDGRS